MNLNITNSMLAPGPDGPVATTRYVAMLEGVQESEARIVIERALSDPRLKARLGKSLVQRCESELALRSRAMWKCLSSMQLTGPGWSNGLGWRWAAGVSANRWFLGSGWQQRSEAIFDLADEVARKVGF